MNPNQEEGPPETTKTQKVKWCQFVKRPPVLGTLIGLLACPLLVYLIPVCFQVAYLFFPLPYCVSAMDFEFNKMEIMGYDAVPLLLIVLQCLLYGWFIGRCLGRKQHRRLILVGLLVHVLPMAGVLMGWYTR